MERSWIDFESCVHEPRTGGSWTSYEYPLGPDAVGFVDEGLAALRQLGSLTLSFSLKAETSRFQRRVGRGVSLGWLVSI